MPLTFIQPMAAAIVDRLPEGDDWTYEVKFAWDNPHDSPDALLG